MSIIADIATWVLNWVLSANACSCAMAVLRKANLARRKQHPLLCNLLLVTECILWSSTQLGETLTYYSIIRPCSAYE